MADAVEALRQHVEQEAADELVGAEGHGALALGAVATVVLVAEGDAGIVERDQPAVRNGDAVSVSRQIGEHCLWPGEGGLGVHDPLLFAERREVTTESLRVA